MTMFDTEPRPCSPPSMWRSARGSANGPSVIAIGNVSLSCDPLTARRRPNATSISSWTTMRPTSTQRSKRGLQRDRATIFTSRRHPPHGSIRWSAGSASSANRPSSAARSTASLNASRRLRASSHNTMPPLRPSSGSRRRSRSSTSSNVYLRVFVGQDTSSLGRGRSSGTRNR